MRPENVSLNAVTEKFVDINEVMRIDSAGYLDLTCELDPGSEFTASISP